MNRSYNSPISSQKARPFLVIRTCKHIKDHGALGQAAALRGSRYCLHHVQLHKRSSKMARAGRRAGTLKLLPLVDMHAVQINLARVRAAVEAGHLNQERARLMRWGLRQAAENLLFMQQTGQVEPSPTRMTTAREPPRKPKRIYQIPVPTDDSITWR